jgi:hypothetical protein
MNDAHGLEPRFVGDRSAERHLATRQGFAVCFREAAGEGQDASRSRDQFALPRRALLRQQQEFIAGPCNFGIALLNDLVEPVAKHNRCDQGEQKQKIRAQAESWKNWYPEIPIGPHC